MKDIQKWNVSKLDLINKMALLREGNIPISIVVLKGHRTNVEYVAKVESNILGSYFHVLKKNEQIKPGAVNFVAYDVESGDISWLKERYEEFNVDNFHTFNWDDFFVMLGLEGLSKELFSDFTLQMETKLDESMEDIVTKVLYAHYEKCNDNVVTEKDVQMIRRLVTSDSKSKPVTKKEPKKESIKVEPEVKPKKEPVKESVEEPVEVLKEVNEDVDSNIEAPQEEVQKTDSSDDIEPPKPKENDEKAPSIVVKESLTKEEEDNNEQLLSNLRALYKETLQYINKNGNSQYRIIANKMQDAVDTDIYKQQFTKMYLEISDDTSTELYSRLYTVDIETQKFQKGVIHQVKHLGCFNCGFEWDEDITFRPKGPNFVHCPQCYNDYPFEK